MEQLKIFMNLGQSCEYLKVSRNTLNKFIRLGLKVSVINGTKRIRRDDADEFMKKHLM
jgi:predicted site-specific integrase-resolvase